MAAAASERWKKIVWRVGTGTFLGEKKGIMQVPTVGAAQEVLEATRRGHK